jgi:uncharacterized membrane protein HdeD (DUF308 family)
LSRNRTQAINLVVSIVTTAAVVVALVVDAHWVLYVFGVWATFAGLLQLATTVRRWSNQGAQWAMILSGGQSAVIGAVFVWCRRSHRPHRRSARQPATPRWARSTSWSPRSR